MRTSLQFLSFALLLAGLLIPAAGSAQDLQRFHLGSEADARVEVAAGGLLLLGGGGDVPEAERWFLSQAKGGDLVVIRSSGSDGYNAYFFRELGITLNSVTSWVIRSRHAASDPDLIRSVRNAEAVFIAGGDQSKYVRFWKDTPLQLALNAHLVQGKPLGGTSAGLAVTGEFLYAALHDGDLTSAIALQDPLHPLITLETEFLRSPLMRKVVTDSHFSERSRLGRLVAFLARLETDFGCRDGLGIGVDEKTALIVEGDGTATVAGRGTVTLVQLDSFLEPLQPEQSLEAGFTVTRLGPESRFNLRDWTVDQPVSFTRILATHGGLQDAGAEDSPFSRSKAYYAHKARGSLVIVGGGLRDSNRAVHERFLSLASREGRRLVAIIPAASSRPVATARHFRDTLLRYGAREDEIAIVPLAVRDDPSTPETDESLWASHRRSREVLEVLEKATGIWFTGGDQTRITALLGDRKAPTPALEAVWSVFRDGGVVGGTSAGAAIQSDPMIAGGASLAALRGQLRAEPPPVEDQEQGPLSLRPGFGFFPHGIIDQHFDRKARLGRLIAALEHTGEQEFGFGIDEDTAFIYTPADDLGSVLGSGGVTVLDMRDVVRSESGGFRGIRLSYLMAGDHWDFGAQMLLPADSRSPTVGREYQSIEYPSDQGLLAPYSGRLEDVLGYLLLDNTEAREVYADSWHAESGEGFRMLIRQDPETAGYWGYTDGRKDSYSVHRAQLELQPIRVKVEAVGQE